MKKALVVLALAGSVARAEEPVPVARPFVTPSLDGRSAIGLDFGLTSYEAPTIFGQADVVAVTLDLVADVAIPGAPVLVFARMPLIFVDADTSLTDCCDQAFGNLTLGGRFVSAPRVTRGDRKTVVGAEVSASLPTADDDGQEAIAAALAGIGQLAHDIGYYLPNVTTLRGSGLLYAGVGRGFFQGQLGLQVLIEDDDDPGTDDETETDLRLAVAGGVFLTPELAALAELTTLANLSDLDPEGDGDGFWHALDLGVRGYAKHATIGAHLYVPLDESFRDFDLFGFGIDLRGTF
jgi:hypothetical protein